MRRPLLALAILLALAPVRALTLEARAETAVVESAAADKVSVTVYRDNLALITETRTVTLPGGPVKIAFVGVLDSIIPQSAVIRGAGVESERNFDFDGLTPSSLFRRSIGEGVQTVRTNRKTGQTTTEDATLTAAGDGVVLAYRDRLEALGCSGFPEQVVFKRIPAGLRATPTLSTTLAASAPGAKTITLSYLATGLSWKADYVVTLAKGAPNADVAAWVTLTNAGEQGFRDADVGVVAGDLHRVLSENNRRALSYYIARACWPTGSTTDFPPAPLPPPPPPPPQRMAMRAMMAMPAPAPMEADVMVTAAKRVEREELGDYQFYRLAEPTGLAARQTKQVLFLAKPAAKSLIVHRFWLGDPRGFGRGPAQTEIKLRFQNEDAAGLGEPLPAGNARVMAPGAYGALFAGADTVKDTPVGVKWEFTVGDSTSVTAKAKLIERKETTLGRSRKRRQDTVEVELTNALATPAAIEVMQARLGDSFRIADASAGHSLQDGEETFALSLAPHERKTLRIVTEYLAP